MKKILVFFLLAIFLIGILPATLAQNKNSGNGKSLLSEDLAKGAAKIRERNISAEKLRTMAQNLAQLRLNYSDKKELYQLKKNTLLELKQGYTNCKGKTDSECAEINEEFLDNAKQYMLNLADLLINNLEEIKTNINSSEYIDEETATDLIEKIDADITQLNEIKTKIEQATTRDELKSAFDELKPFLSEVKNKIKYRIAKIYGYKVSNVIQRAEQLEIKLQKFLDRLTEQGYDTTNVENLIDQFNQKIEDAKSKYYEAMDLFDQFKDENLDQTKNRQAHDLLKSAHKDLQDAQSILMQIIKEIKGINEDVIENDCWSDRPEFTPGYDLGYFIWQSNCSDNTWYIDWSGNINNNGTWHNFSGQIKAIDGQFKNVGPKSFDNLDSFKWNSTEISFTAKAGPYFDGLHFQTTGTKIEFDIQIDGESKTGIVYIGKDLTHPSDIPFQLTGDASSSSGLVCKSGEFLFQGQCRGIAKGFKVKQNTVDDSTEITPGKDTDEDENIQEQI